MGLLVAFVTLPSPQVIVAAVVVAIVNALLGLTIAIEFSIAMVSPAAAEETTCVVCGQDQRWWLLVHPKCTNCSNCTNSSNCCPITKIFLR
jgi:hypothetical protein